VNEVNLTVVRQSSERSESQPQESALLSARVPRYTSYPTAPHFHAGIDATAYKGWLGSLPDESDLSLYLHIPFCDTLCWFCGCHTRVVNNYRPVAGYLHWLNEEIALVADALRTPRRVTHLHWGGGSPTLLSPPDIRKVSANLRSRFAVADDAEFAVEIDPRGLSDETIAALAEAGVTRASIGVQDCDPAVQRAINRVQPFSVTESAVKRLRGAGISAINIDLVYGLPHQTAAHVERTIAAMLTLRPQRFAIFGYAHVPSFKKHQQLISEDALPGAEERHAQYLAAAAMLTADGYVAIGLDHFALPEDPLTRAAQNGTLRRNFQGYTTDAADALIGFGASAISSLPQGYAQNAADVPAWRAQLMAGRLPIARGIVLSAEDRLRRAVIEKLMCGLEADLPAMARACGFGRNVFAREIHALDAHVARGWLTRKGDRFRISPAGREFSRIVCAVFDTHLDDGAARHSVAV
jgi:oxygen-independent coproporphyrinogen-3 oxidase